jgi:MFS family permease
MTFSRNEKHVLQLTAVGHFGAHFAMLIFPTVAVVMAAEEGLALETVLGWSFAGFMLFGAGGLPVGYLADHLRAVWVVRVGVIGLGLAVMAVSMADPGPALALSLALVGVFASLYHPAGLGLISRTVAARGEALGINGMFGNVGIAGAPLAAQLACSAWGWRGAYLVLGAGLLLMGLLVAMRSINEATPGSLTADDQHESGERRRLFLILLVAMTFGGLAYRANTVAQPAYFDARVGQMGHGVATSLVYGLGILGQWAGGRLADRYDLRILYLCFQARALPFVLLMSVLAGLPLLLAAAGYVFFAIGMQPIENSLVARFTPDRWRCTGYGLKFSVVFGIGALSVRGVQQFLERGTLSGVFVAVGGIIALLVCVAAYLAWRTRAAPILNQAATPVAERQPG